MTGFGLHVDCRLHLGRNDDTLRPRAGIGGKLPGRGSSLLGMASTGTDEGVPPVGFARSCDDAPTAAFPRLGPAEEPSAPIGCPHPVALIAPVAASEPFARVEPSEPLAPVAPFSTVPVGTHPLRSRTARTPVRTVAVD